MSRSRRDMVLTYVMGGLVAFAAYNFVIKPQRAELSDVRDKLASVEQQVGDTEIRLGAAQQPDEQVAATGASAAIPVDAQLPALLRQLQYIADATGMSIAAIAPSAVVDNPLGPGGSMELTITGSGPHSAVADYLQAVRDLERQAVVEQIGVDMQRSDAATDPQTDELQLTVRVFTAQAPVDTNGS